MPQLTERIVINADRDTIWSLLTDPGKIAEWYEGIDSMEGAAGYPAAGGALKWTYKAAGIEFKGSHTIQKIVRGQEIDYRLDGLITGTQNWKLNDAGGGMEVEVDTDYSMSGGVLGKLAEPVVHQMNVSNGRKSLQNLKRMAEGG